MRGLHDTHHAATLRTPRDVLITELAAQLVSISSKVLPRRGRAGMLAVILIILNTPTQEVFTVIMPVSSPQRTTIYKA
jgi:hypothetical protein